MENVLSKPDIQACLSTMLFIKKGSILSKGYGNGRVTDFVLYFLRDLFRCNYNIYNYYFARQQQFVERAIRQTNSLVLHFRRIYCTKCLQSYNRLVCKLEKPGLSYLIC